jgi:F-type H+-transporting ATPase subunit epsilon
MAMAGPSDAHATALALTLATPLGMQLNLSVESVQLPGVAGEFGVLPNHIPLLAALKPGVVRYRESGVTKIAAIGSGFSEAGADHVRVITEFFARPEEIRVEEARVDLTRRGARRSDQSRSATQRRGPRRRRTGRGSGRLRLGAGAHRSR